MALRAGLVAVMLPVMVAISGPMAAASDDPGCAVRTGCVESSHGGDETSCLTDARCAGLHVAGSALVIVAIVAAIGLLVPGLLGRRHAVASITAPPPLLIGWPLLRPPQPLLPS